jgi:pimeloyl-ACP methyl ester carboxylesterase
MIREFAVPDIGPRLEERMTRTNPSQMDWPRRDGAAWVGPLRLHYAAWGPKAAPPLLLLHGGAANTHWWDWLAPELAGASRLLALDFPGHGRSAWPRPPRYRMPDFVAAVVGFAKELGIRRLDLVGHSMGGKVGMLVAARHPRLVRSLVIVDATPDVSPDGLAEMRQISTRPLRLFPSRHVAARSFRLIPPETVSPPARCQALALESARHRGFGRWIIGPDREFFRRVVPQVAWPALSRIRCPTLILRAERSSILSRQTAEAMRCAIPRATLLEVPDTCHHLVFEDPAKVGRAIRKFLAAHPSTRSRHRMASLDCSQPLQLHHGGTEYTKG